MAQAEEHFDDHGSETELTKRILANPKVRRSLDETAAWLKANPDYEVCTDEEFDSLLFG